MIIRFVRAKNTVSKLFKCQVKILRVFFPGDNFRSAEYFCEQPKTGEEFRREHFKICHKKASKPIIFELKKARKKKYEIGPYIPTLAIKELPFYNSLTLALFFF